MPVHKWWQEAVFYQIYPRSFADGNGDGIGDLAGMIDRLEYLRDLGIDALWLSPHYPSPLFDCGYDVADYTDVAPEYGTLDDFQRFLDGAHQRGIRVILDLVLNHTSHQHPWFLASRASRNNSHADWYVWRDGRDGGPPNNWLSTFGGSAWEYAPERNQYYYHYFFKEQPDLNWRNPAVKDAMFAAVRFWLDRGVDGFRLDAIGTIFEDPDLTGHTARHTHLELMHLDRQAVTPGDRAAIAAEYRAMFGRQHDLPGVHELMRELRQVVDAYDDRVLVGETDDLAYHGRGDDELHLVFNFPLMRTPRLTPAWVRANQRERLAALPPGAWPCNTLGNHDSPRVWSRFGDGQHDAQIARVALALMLTLPGTPFLYNGEEIGMTDLLLDDLAQMKDLIAHWRFHAEREVFGLSHAAALALAAVHGRDKCRTPNQWTSAPNAGFCPPGVTPWLPVHPNYAHGVNAADQARDPASLLNFYRRLLRVRRATPALRTGAFDLVDDDAEDYLAFVRTGAGERVFVGLNFSDRPQTLAYPLAGARPIYASAERATALQDLAPFEILITLLP
jgi:alpha-glucosidase